MAAMADNQVTIVYTNGDCERFALFSVKNCTTGDTYDLGVKLYFRVIEQVMWMGATVNGTEAGTFTGTAVTVPAGLAAAGAWMLVAGVAY